MIGPAEKYRLFNHGAAHAKFTPNSLKISIHRKDTIIFHDGQKIIIDLYPTMKFSRFLIGRTKYVWKGPRLFTEVTNRLERNIFFDYGVKKGGIFSSEKSMGDEIEGIYIYRPLR